MVKLFRAIDHRVQEELDVPLSILLRKLIEVDDSRLSEFEQLYSEKSGRSRLDRNVLSLTAEDEVELFADGSELAFRVEKNDLNADIGGLLSRSFSGSAQTSSFNFMNFFILRRFTADNYFFLKN